jgi:hypothetical protein
LVLIGESEPQVNADVAGAVSLKEYTVLRFGEESEQQIKYEPNASTVIMTIS